MTKDEFWEAINTGGKVYTYKDEIDFYMFLQYMCMVGHV